MASIDQVSVWLVDWLIVLDRLRLIDSVNLVPPRAGIDSEISIDLVEEIPDVTNQEHVEEVSAPFENLNEPSALRELQ